ncbi:MAG TPA: carboxypeptidase-like regulatory domain-containing protein [Vicinamibacterales bacterium]|nr:carboxypeptidase-like regulatory domain-containing protein [Vicinamibacterales bacterium]
MESENPRRSPDRRPASHRLPARELAFALGFVWLAAGAPHTSTAHAQQPPRDNRRPSAPARAGTASIRGRVINDAGDPLRKARVTLNAAPGTSAPSPFFGGRGVGPPPAPAAENASPPSIFTDNDGRFELTGLDAGRYTLAIRKAGYVPPTYGARHTGEPPIGIDLEDGARTDVVVRLARSAGISGRIVDEYGEPIEGILVSAERLIRLEGRLTTRPAGSSSTDDRGEYRIGALTASRYVISANVNRGGSESVTFRFGPGAEPDAMQELMMQVPGMSQVRAYYPGVIGLSDAEPIEARTGEERTSVDFSIPPNGAIPTLTLSFVDADGKPAPGEATLTNPGSAIQRFVPMLARNPKIAARVEPGIWTVLARGPAGVGTVDVTVGSGDASATVVLDKGGRASGRVETDGSPLPAMRFAISASHPAETGPTSRWGAMQPTRPDGTFQLSDLLGPLTFRVANPPKGWAVKEIVYQARDVSETPIEFKPTTAIDGIRVVMTNRTATLTGAAADTQGIPVADYSVLVFPENAALPVRQYARWARPNQQGRFTIEDLLPGDYLVVAVSDVDDTQWQNRDYLARFRGTATRVALAESARQTLSLQVAPQ